MRKEILYICVIRLGAVYTAWIGAVGIYLYHRSATGNSFTGFYYGISGPVPFINSLIITGIGLVGAVFWLRAFQTYTLRSSASLTNKFLALACLTITTIFASFGASILFRILFE
jgi:hypothetical protein